MSKKNQVQTMRQDIKMIDAQTYHTSDKHARKHYNTTIMMHNDAP
jgi:hypothetical protein